MESYVIFYLILENKNRELLLEGFLEIFYFNY